MRALVKYRSWRLMNSLAVSGLLAAGLWQAGPWVMLIALFVLLALAMFWLLTVAPDLIAWQRGHSWRWWWRSFPDDGPFWPGSRIPRLPRRPSGPARTAVSPDPHPHP